MLKLPALPASFPTAPLRLALRLAPDPVLMPLVAAVVTHLLRGQHAPGLAELDGKLVSLLFTEPSRELRFRLTPVGIAAVPSSRTAKAWDVRIRGSLDDFWLLASGAEDPDTLFFQRRLAIEGETETGLALKNLLDALEYNWRGHVAAVLGPFIPRLR